jgi:hypothetical protein
MLKRCASVSSSRGRIVANSSADETKLFYLSRVIISTKRAWGMAQNGGYEPISAGDEELPQANLVREYRNVIL